MINLTPFVRKTVKAAPRDDIEAALKALVAERLRKSSQRTQRIPASTPQDPLLFFPQRAKPLSSKRRSPRKLGRIRFYTPTDKVDVSRLGTWRHHMISVIRRHTNTRDAQLENTNHDNPKFASQRLDFNWAADNGFINWN